MTNYMEESLKDLPRFLSSADLVEIGLYKTQKSVHMARSRGVGPDCMHIGAKLLYPRESIIRFVCKHMDKKEDETQE